MEKFYLEVPTIERKQEAIEFVNEFNEYNSKVNGSGGLDRYVDDYEGWLVKLEEYLHLTPNKDKVPAVTYFLVRSNDNRIVGMINIRLALNDYLRRGPGHIGYSIRPTERRKGYNKINLYLGLKVCREHGIDNVLMDANAVNPASWRTMEALGGKRVKEWVNEDGNEVYNYEIDTNASLEKYALVYEPLIEENSHGGSYGEKHR